MLHKFGTVNSHKEIVIGLRGDGKTKEMIKLSEKTGCYIVTFSEERARLLFNTARQLGCNIPFPAVYRNIFDLHNLKDVIVDDADSMLELLLGKRIIGMSIDCTDTQEDIPVQPTYFPRA